MNGSSDRPLIGKLGEALACEYLRMSGYQILERNYRCQIGEIDIIASEGDALAFVEVRTKTSDAYGLPVETIRERKRAKLRQVAGHYLSERGPRGRCMRFDVVGILFREGEEPVIELIRNAFYRGE